MPQEQHVLPLVALLEWIQQLPEGLPGRDHYVALLDDLIGDIEVSDYNLSDSEEESEDEEESDTESDSEEEEDYKDEYDSDDIDELLNHDPDKGWSE